MTITKPVLVTGSPRSGTTWVGRMLSVSSKLYYIHEPFNPDFRPGSGVCNIRFKHHQTYITQANETGCFKPISRMVEGIYDWRAALLACRSKADINKTWNQMREFRGYRRSHMLPLIKDPIALVSAGWLGTRFDLNVIVMIRHPAAFVASMKRLNWGFDPSRWALSQPLLLKDHLAPLEEELKTLRDTQSDIIDQAALFWKVIYFVVLKYRETYPDWIFLRHEDIALDPMVHFKMLCEKIGIDFTSEMEKQIDEYSNASNPSQSRGAEKLIKLNSKKAVSNWKNLLSAQEIERVRDRVEEVSKYYYADGDWKINGE